MGPLRQPGLARLAFFAWLVGCSTTALMDSMEDDMGAPRSGESVQSACSACFDNICAWQTTECAADPGCATWLTCAKEASLAEAESPECAAGLGPTATLLKQALVSCIDSTRCCESNFVDSYDAGDIDPLAADGGPGGSGGAGGSGGVDGIGEAGPSGTWDTCVGCVSGQCDFSACYQVHECKVLAGDFSKCVQDVRASNPPDETRALEACVFPHASVAKASGGLQAFLDFVWPCIHGACADSCTLDPAKVCAACQSQKCASELSSVFSDDSAVLALWCRSHCQKHPEDEECDPSVTGGPPAKCEEFLVDSMEVLAPYLQCVQLSCGEEC